MTGDGCSKPPPRHMYTYVTELHDLHMWTHMDHLRSGVRDQPSQHDETLSLLKIQKISRAWWWVPVIPATQGLRQENRLYLGGGGCNRESPGREATRVASATLLAGAALPSTEYTGRTGSAGPIPTRKTAIGSAED
ncbi:hypothetical protein AAY473_030483 [Plecturocebus cupreus]